jgi:hypothetical protein
MGIKKPAPEKPPRINGNSEAIWNFILHLNGRVDGLYLWLMGMMAVVIATLIAVVLK